MGPIKTGCTTHIEQPDIIKCAKKKYFTCKMKTNDIIIKIFPIKLNMPITRSERI